MPRRYALWAWERRPDGLTLLMAAIGLAGAALVLARQSAYGPGLTSDSLQFIAGARFLAAGAGDAVSFYWPPLYPLLLAIGSLGVFDPLSVVAPLNAAAFGLTAFIIGRYLRRRLASRFMAAWGCAMVALSVPLAWWASWALSDTLFILLATLALTRADDYLREGKTSALIWAAIFGALAWQTRYLGIAIPAAIGLALLFQRGATPPQRAGRVALVGLAAALPMALWLWRNYLVFGDLPGANYGRQPDALGEMLRAAAAIMWDWAHLDLPNAGWGFLGALPLAVVGAALTAIAAAFLIAALISGLISGLISSPAAGAFKRGGCVGRAGAAFDWRPIWLFGVFGAAHFALLIAGLRQGQEPAYVNPRYLAPQYIPLLVIVAVALDALLSRAERWRAARSAGARVGGRVAAGALIAGLAVWLAAAGAVSLAETARAVAGELDMAYAMPRWTNSDTLRYLRENPVEGEVYSNFPSFLHHSSGGREHYRGFRSAQRDTESKSGLEKVARWVANAPDGAHVIWFADAFVNRDKDYGAGTMRTAPGLRTLADLSDGAAFRVSRGYAPRENPYGAAHKAIAAGDWGEPAARAEFRVYLSDGAVAYLKEPCSATDAGALSLFFLHIFPQDAANLPAERRESGFVNADFVFADYGANFDGKCVAIAPLPDYPVERIRTGQYVPYRETALWSAEVNANRDRYMAAYRAIASGEYGEPAAQAAYAVYRRGDSLVYAREPCAPEDIQARFFLHIFPQDAANLPAERKESGFVNADFDFAERGADLGGKCVAIAPLPNYAIERIRTGQHLRGEGQIWRAELE